MSSEHGSQIEIYHNKHDHQDDESTLNTSSTSKFDVDTAAPGFHQGFRNDKEIEEYSHIKELTKIEEMSRMLNEIQQTLNQASMRSHLLNIDVVTQFNPYHVDMLKKNIEDCHGCIERMKQRNEKVMESLDS